MPRHIKTSRDERGTYDVWELRGQGRRKTWRALEGKRCIICGRKDDLRPYILDVCTKCLLNRFSQPEFRGALKIVGIGTAGHCAICGKFHMVLYRINTWLCDTCARKIKRWSTVYSSIYREFARRHPTLFGFKPRVL